MLKLSASIRKCRIFTHVSWSFGIPDGYTLTVSYMSSGSFGKTGAHLEVAETPPSGEITIIYHRDF